MVSATIFRGREEEEDVFVNILCEDFPEKFSAIVSAFLRRADSDRAAEKEISFLGKDFFGADNIRNEAVEFVKKRVIEIVKDIGLCEALSFFHAIIRMDAPQIEMVLEFVKKIGPAAAKEYFHTIEWHADDTETLAALTSENVCCNNGVVELIKDMGGLARVCFDAINAKTVGALTSIRVLEFVKKIGPAAARAYLDTIRWHADSVDALTSENVCCNNGVVEAVKDMEGLAELYFNAINAETVYELTSERRLKEMPSIVREWARQLSRSAEVLC